MITDFMEVTGRIAEIPVCYCGNLGVEHKRDCPVVAYVGDAINVITKKRDKAYGMSLRHQTQLRIAEAEVRRLADENLRLGAAVRAEVIAEAWEAVRNVPAIVDTDSPATAYQRNPTHVKRDIFAALAALTSPEAK